MHLHSHVLVFYSPFASLISICDVTWHHDDMLGCHYITPKARVLCLAQRRSVVQYWVLYHWGDEQCSSNIPYTHIHTDGTDSVTSNTDHDAGGNNLFHQSDGLCWQKQLLRQSTVGCKKLDPLFFLNNSLNIQHRTLKSPAMCFYWAVRHFNFFDLFALLSTLTYLERYRS